MTSFLDKLKTKLEGSAWNAKIIPPGAENTNANKLTYKVTYASNTKQFTVTPEQAEYLLQNPDIFKYNFVDGYKAIWSKELKCVECEISSESHNFLDTSVLTFGGTPEGDSLTIQCATPEFIVLMQLKKKRAGVDPEKITNLINRDSKKKSLTIKITRTDIDEDKLNDVIHMFNSACFNMECDNTNTHYMPIVDIPLEKPTVDSLIPDASVTFTLLNTTCRDAVSIYWHARSMRGGRLLLQKFLGFYQVLENFFPIYTEKATTKAIDEIIRNNASSPNIAKAIFDKVKKTFINTSEREMLEEVLKNVFSDTTYYTELKQWLGDSKNKKYFSRSPWRNGPAFKIYDQKIATPTDEPIGTVSEMSKRIYSIRCRIVHTKPDHNQENYQVLHARSPEVAHIERDIALLEFLAKKVLMSYRSSSQE